MPNKVDRLCTVIIDDAEDAEVEAEPRSNFNLRSILSHIAPLIISVESESRSLRKMIDSRLRLSAHKFLGLTFQHNAREPSRGKCTGINIDPIRQRFRLFHRRMPVYDDLAEIHRAIEKLVADPQ